MPYSISYPTDENYVSAAFENGVQVIGATRSLVKLKVSNTGAALVWVSVWDAKPTGGSNPAAAAHKTLLALDPVAGPGFNEWTIHGGKDVEYGLWAGAYSTAALALAGGAPDAGNVLFIRADYGAPKVLPLN